MTPPLPPRAAEPVVSDAEVEALSAWLDGYAFFHPHRHGVVATVRALLTTRREISNHVLRTAELSVALENEREARRAADARVAAAVLAERKAMREELDAMRVVVEDAAYGDHVGALNTAHSRILALIADSPTHADTLATMLAAAEARGRESGVREAAAACLRCDGPLNNAGACHNAILALLQPAQTPAPAPQGGEAG